jgi:uncharacterized circularly permuted ATP-grasp superfamily protein/uncharacterized alpha-E superfamily protein
MEIVPRVNETGEKQVRRTKQGMSRWDEIHSGGTNPRPPYQKLLHHLYAQSMADLRNLDERMEATLREMGVTLNLAGQSQRPWICDLLPQVLDTEEWRLIEAGFRQRMQAFDFFLQDVYGRKQILRDGVIPIHPVLGSRDYQKAAVGLPHPQDSYLHLSGLCITRDEQGRMAVKNHHFSHASGISYMMQNRRALARITPEIFEDAPVHALADAPQAIVEKLRDTADRSIRDPSVILLSPGMQSAVYSEHSFLARRMGIPLVQGGDLLVLDDCVYLKTVQGLERVEVIYSRMPDSWLDPLVFHRSSRVGIPGLIHCLRKGTVTVVNGIGSQLADDRGILCFAQKIIQYYLNERPVLPTLPTYWMGDIDQMEMVLANLENYQIRPIMGYELHDIAERTARATGEFILQEVRRNPCQYIAQPAGNDAATVCFEKGKKVERVQDHIVFALRTGANIDVFPGALTRIFNNKTLFEDNFATWTSKDTWVLTDGTEPALAQTKMRPRRFREADAPSRQVTSRVAEAFYWMGRYLERAYHQAYLIQVIETLETEELNSAERKLYRPMWNRLLPPLETSAGTSRRSITNRIDRYRLVLLREPGTVISTLRNAMANAESIQECLSPEAWATLSEMTSRFDRAKYRADIDENECVRVTRKLSDMATRLIPQFFAIATGTMLADDGWRFCAIGQVVERGIITANSVVSISKSIAGGDDMNAGAGRSSEIELSAFLRLLGTRDAYRRVYQMRAEPIPVLEFLWQNSQAPRSVLRCLERCARQLEGASPNGAPGTSGALAALEDLIQRIKRIDWSVYIRSQEEDESPAAKETAAGAIARGDKPRELVELLSQLLHSTLEIHHLISDGFLSHQAHITQTVQPLLSGF